MSDEPPAKRTRSSSNQLVRQNLRRVRSTGEMTELPRNSMMSRGPCYKRKHVMISRELRGGTDIVKLEEPYCLRNMKFVIVGTLRKIKRRQLENIVNDCGGQVIDTTDLSSATHAIVGSNTSISRMAALNEHNVKCILEQKFMDVLQTGNIASLTADPAPAAAALVQTTETQQPVPSAARLDVSNPSSWDWNEKYKPSSIQHVVSADNRAAMVQVDTWLKEWTVSHPIKMMVLHGPPGAGKSMVTSIVCKENNYQIVEIQSGDQRSRNLLQTCITEASDNMDLSSFGMYQGKENTKKILLMEDSTSLPSSQTVSQMVERARVPLLCICVDAKDPRIKTVKQVCKYIPLVRPKLAECRDFVKLVQEAENLKLQGTAVDEVIISCGYDVRQILRALRMIKADGITRSEDVKKKDWNRNIGESASRFFRSDLTFGTLSSEYFTEPSMLSLFVHENYPKVNASSLECMESIAQAADCVLKADVIDQLVHYQQQFSLQEDHALLACILPGSYMSEWQPSNVTFPSCLGRQSSMQRRCAMLTDLRCHTDRCLCLAKEDVRTSVVPMLRRILIDGMEKLSQQEFIDFTHQYEFMKDDIAIVVETLVLCTEHRTLLPPKIRNSLTVVKKGHKLKDRA